MTAIEPFLSNSAPDGFDELDHMAGASFARMTLGFSPVSALLAAADWSLHWAAAPGKRLRATVNLAGDTLKLSRFAAGSLVDDDLPDVIAPSAGDLRFREPGWRHWPFRVWSQGFLLTERWLDQTARGVLGVDAHHEEMVAFGLRQGIDALSPANTPLTNPVVLEKAIATRGASLLHGWRNIVEDISSGFDGSTTIGSEQFIPGETVATTPGRLVYRNDIMEVIQYLPTTDTVQAEPILIVPAWIMKYYILDLSPHNSMIAWLVAQGFTVFCISWRNVTPAQRGFGIDDYRRRGVMAALDVIGSVAPAARVHAVGYCLGGTLLTIAAAAMARDRDERLASITLFAAQTDFTEPGDLQLFIDESQIGALESMMWGRGVLESRQMAGAFRMLQANELVWLRYIHEYLLGERHSFTDLMAWNADGTRMPFRMHTEYLRSLFLRNDLAAGRFCVGGGPVVVQNIRAPFFVVGTEGDRIAPWHSVFKIHYLTDTDVTFVLTSGGHNAGIVNPPEQSRRHYRMRTVRAEQADPQPGGWVEDTPVEPGSWWPAWATWLTQHSTQRVPPPEPGAFKGEMEYVDAPGTYIREH